MKINWPKACIELRSKMNITQTELGNLAHVEISNVHRWEKGQTTPSNRARYTLINLFKEYGVAYEEEDCPIMLKDLLSILDIDSITEIVTRYGDIDLKKKLDNEQIVNRYGNIKVLRIISNPMRTSLKVVLNMSK